jgi:hypothetical protein
VDPHARSGNKRDVSKSERLWRLPSKENVAAERNQQNLRF